MTTPRLKPLGIFGGTFDPVHCGHMQLAADACSGLGLDGVLWIPAGKPPHRDAPVVTPEQRLAMVALAIRGDPRFSLDDGESRSADISYTVDTLLRLRKANGTKPLVLLLGADAFLGFSTWYRWREIFSLAHIGVATRPGYALDIAQMDPELREEYQRRIDHDKSAITHQKASRIVAFAITPLDISASAIRVNITAGENVHDLLPPAVLDYIANNHLYSDN